MAIQPDMHPDVLDAKLTHIRDNCDAMYLVDGYTARQSWGTLNIVATALIDGTTTYWSTLSDTGVNRRIQCLGATVSVTGSHSGTDLGVLIVDTGNSKVLAATDETADLNLNDGEDVDVPPFYIYSLQTTQV